MIRLGSGKLSQFETGIKGGGDRGRRTVASLGQEINNLLRLSRVQHSVEMETISHKVHSSN